MKTLEHYRQSLNADAGFGTESKEQTEVLTIRDQGGFVSL